MPFIYFLGSVAVLVKSGTNIGSGLEIIQFVSDNLEMWLEKPIGKARANQIDSQTDDQNADFDK